MQRDVYKRHGLNNSTYESVKNGNFLSEEQCDFIFAVVGEELGFAGSAFIILIYPVSYTHLYGHWFCKNYA